MYIFYTVKKKSFFKSVWTSSWLQSRLTFTSVWIQTMGLHTCMYLVMITYKSWMYTYLVVDTDHLLTTTIEVHVGIHGFILPLIEILKFDWLRQILYAAILCFLTNLIFLIYPLHVTYWPHITFLNPFHVTFRGILHYDVTQLDILVKSSAG